MPTLLWKFIDIKINSIQHFLCARIYSTYCLLMTWIRMTFSNFDIPFLSMPISLFRPVPDRNSKKKKKSWSRHTHTLTSFCLFLSLLDHRVNSYIQSKDITNRRNNTVSGHFFRHLVVFLSFYFILFRLLLLSPCAHSFKYLEYSLCCNLIADPKLSTATREALSIEEWVCRNDDRGEKRREKETSDKKPENRNQLN